MQEENPIRIYYQEIGSGYCQETYERQVHAKNWIITKSDVSKCWQNGRKRL